MSARLKRRSSIARRAFLVVLFSLLVLLGGLAALLGWMYEELDAVLGQQPASAAAWLGAQQLAIAQALLLWPIALALLLGTVLLGWLLARWATRPLDQLVAAATMMGREHAARNLPVRASGEVGQLARSFDELAQSMQRSSRELEEQNRSLTATARRLDRLLRVEQELNATLDTDQQIRRVVAALRGTFGYERAGIALIEGENLVYYFNDGTKGSGFIPPVRVPLNDRSVAASVARSGMPLRVDDLRVGQEYLASPGLPTTRAELAVPVCNADQRLAVIVLQSSQPAAFDADDEQQMMALATQLMIALTNANLYHAEQLRRQLAEAIYRVSQTLSAALAPEGVPELILDQLAQVLPYDRSALLLIDGENLEIAAARGFANTQALVRSRVRLDETPLIAEIVRLGRAIIVADAQHDPRYRVTLSTVPARSWLGVPLLRQGNVSGVLMLEGDQPNRYGQEELYAIAALANQAAIAMENARLYAEAQERMRQLEVVTHMTQVVSTRDVSGELPGILRTIIHQIRRVVPCDRAAIALYNEEDDTFMVETVYDFAVRDWSDLPAGEAHPAAQTPWQTACRTGGPLVQTDLTRSAFAHDKWLAESGLRSCVVVPIVGANRAVGTLDFASRQLGAYGQVQVTTLLELSHYLGSALHNARLTQEREETAAKLARTQEHLNLVDKVRAVGQLASGVAHDFNNLLGGILGNAQLLLFEVQDSQQRELLKIIERAARDGAETVRRLQGFARMEHDTPMTEVRLDTLAHDAIELTRPRWRDVAQSRGATITIIRKLDPVMSIAGRPAELREVLTNMIINAVDALPKGGSITVSTYNDHNDGADSGSVIIEVADTGTGMPPDVLERIFDPFFTTKGEQGTGLGLAVSMGIVQSHGGRIEVESAAGQGTRFIIRLPVRVAEQAGKRKAARPAPITPGHILFVENEAMIRDATVRLLTRWGHTVSQASGGVEALQMFLPDLYDVVISDLGMPDMNGWELLAQIKQRDQRLPTILITGWGRQVSDEEARVRGVDYMIEKPFDQDDLREVLAEAMNTR